MRNAMRAIMLINMVTAASWTMTQINTQGIIDQSISYLFSWSIGAVVQDFWWCATCTHVLHTHVIRTVFSGKHALGHWISTPWQPSRSRAHTACS